MRLAKPSSAGVFMAEPTLQPLPSALKAYFAPVTTKSWKCGRTMRLVEEGGPINEIIA